MVDLFENERNKAMSREAPLAARMRPRTFDEYVGQEHIVGPGRVLRLSIEADRLPSIILWGPPGSGKTTLAHLIANITQSHFDPVSAVTAGVADLRKVVAQARERRGMYGRRTILFVTRSTASTRPSRTSSCPTSKRGPSHSSARPRRTRPLRSLRRSCRDAASSRSKP